MKNRQISSGMSRYAPIIMLLVSTLMIAGCSLIDDISGLLNNDPPQPETMTLKEALTVETEDQRPTILEKMGVPDAFSIRFDTLDGQVVRWESWSYFDFGSGFEFVDGELLWTVEVEPVPDGTLYAHFYTPEIFQAHMSTAAVKKLLAGRPLEEIDLSGEDIENGVLLVGDQIMLGFDQDRLVYVETLVLTPDEAAQAAATPKTQNPTAQPTKKSTATPKTQNPTPQPTKKTTATLTAGKPAPRAVGALILADDFESATPKAYPFYSEKYMTMEQVNGRMRLQSNYSFLSIFATYQLPPLQDFIAEFDVITAGLEPSSDVGFKFRGATGDVMTHHYSLVLRPSEGQVGLKAYKDQKFVTYEYEPIPPALKSKDGSYRIRLEVEGASFRVFMNGSYLTEFTDNQILEAGRLGPMLSAMKTPQAVLFDNLKIYQLP